MSANQEEAPAQWEPFEQSSPSKRVGRLSPGLLRTRYPRLLEAIPGLDASTPRARPVAWLLKLVDDIYDALSEALIPATALHGTDAFAATMGPLLSPRPESLRVDNSVSRRDAAKRGPRSSTGQFALPLFTRRFLHHSLGLPSLADQDCVDLAYNVERRREELPHVALFSSFLRELIDGDTLLFFLVVRTVAQRELRLQLGSKEKLARTSSSKQYTHEGLCVVVPHPLVPDGTKQVQLSPAGCECVLRRLFAYALELRRTEPAAPVPAPFVLAQFVRTDSLAVLFRDADTAPIERFFALLVDSFRSVSEDIVAQFKYNDDGTSHVCVVAGGAAKARSNVSALC